MRAKCWMLDRERGGRIGCAKLHVFCLESSGKEGKHSTGDIFAVAQRSQIFGAQGIIRVGDAGNRRAEPGTVTSRHAPRKIGVRIRKAAPRPKIIQQCWREGR